MKRFAILAAAVMAVACCASVVEACPLGGLFARARARIADRQAARANGEGGLLSRTRFLDGDGRPLLRAR